MAIVDDYGAAILNGSRIFIPLSKAGAYIQFYTSTSYRIIDLVDYPAATNRVI